MVLNSNRAEIATYCVQAHVLCGSPPPFDYGGAKVTKPGLLENLGMSLDVYWGAKEFSSFLQNSNLISQTATWTMTRKPFAQVALRRKWL